MKKTNKNMSYEDLGKDMDNLLLTRDLDLTAQGLAKIIINQPLSKKEKNNLRFWGKIFERMQNHESYPELTTLTTMVEPEFRNTIPPQNNDYAEISKLMQQPYGNTKLAKEELTSVYKGIRLISTNITARLQSKYKMGQI